MPPPMFPKVAVVCGAHTELGKLVLRELLRSPDVELVHALSEVDIRDAISARPTNMRKLRLYIDSLDYVDRTLSRRVTDADIAFVTLGSSRDDLSARGPYAFHRDNFDVPRRFIEAMFRLAVQRIAVLSAAGADSRVRGSEFLRVKGELVDVIVRMLREAGRHAPAVALFRVPLLLSNKLDLHGGGRPAPLFNKIKQHAVLKFDLGASQAVHIRDVAKAMVADTLANSEREEESDLSFRFKKRQYDLIELTGRDIVSIANETRALQKSSFQRRKDKDAVAQRISQFAKQEGAVHDQDEHDGDNEPGSTHSDERLSNASGSLPESHPGTGTHEGEGSPHAGSQYDISPRVSGEDGLPRVQHVRQQSLQSGSIPSSRPSSAVGNGKAVPLGSVASLGHQLGRRLTKIKGNELLPDIERDVLRRRPPSKLSVQKNMDALHNASADMCTLPQQDADIEEPVGHMLGDDGLETRSGSSTQSIASSNSGEHEQTESIVNEEEIGDMLGGADMPLSEFPWLESYGAIAYRRASGGGRMSASPRESADALPRRGRSQHSYIRQQHVVYGRDRRGEPRLEDVVQEIPPLVRFSALVGRIVATTDRPSQRRRRIMRQTLVAEEELEEEDEYEYDYEPPIRGNGDMREAGNVSI